MAATDLGSNPSLKQLVYQNLRDDIIRGEYQPGERLTEELLSVQMNVSRAPIREAFNMLERDGFVRIAPRRGAFVTEVDNTDIDYIWEIRLLLEPYAAKESIDLIPRTDLEAIKADLEKALENPDNMQLYMDTDLRVHEMISDYQPNRFLKEMIQNIKAHSLRLRWATEYEKPETQKQITTDATNEHMQIIKAFLARDGEAVYQAVKTHIENAKKRLICADRHPNNK